MSCQKAVVETCWPGVAVTAGWAESQGPAVVWARPLQVSLSSPKGPGLGGKSLEGSRLPHPPGQLWAETGCPFLDQGWVILGLTLGRLGPSLAASSLRGASASSRPPPAGGLWSGLSITCSQCLARPLRGAQVPLSSPTLGRFASPSWAWFPRLEVGQGHGPPGLPQDHVSGGAARVVQPCGGRGARSHHQLKLSRLLGLSHACYIGELKQKTCRAWPF